MPTSLKKTFNEPRIKPNENVNTENNSIIGSMYNIVRLRFNCRYIINIKNNKKPIRKLTNSVNCSENE